MRKVARRDLEAEERQLLEQAERAARTAYCPYSGFPVGAAVRLVGRGGEPAVVTGTNSETAHYRSVCAEKHAVHRALAEHSWFEDGELRRPRLEAVAVYCVVAGRPQQPCGDCRQTLFEIEPGVRVIAAAGPGKDGHHDPRVTVTTLRSLLPEAFETASLHGGPDSRTPDVHDGDDLEEQVVHLPRPGALSADASARMALLEGVRYLILCGSPGRARRIAQLAHDEFGAARDADGACYCDLTIPGRDESGRELAVYVSELPGGVRVASVSHGIGISGVEIVLSELPALIALAQGGEGPEIRGALRCGTRGTLARVPLGCVALSTACKDESFDTLYPDPGWLERLRRAARERGLTLVAEDEIEDRGEDRWPPASELVVEGAGMSALYFWRNQGRPLYRPGSRLPGADVLAHERRDRAELLESWVREGVRWVEMEDHAVIEIAGHCGIPAATLGAVIAHRRAADGSFQLDYDKAALAAGELLPPTLALEAIRLDAEGS